MADKLVKHQIWQERWLCSLHNPPSVCLFSKYETVAYCQLQHIFIFFNFSFEMIMHDCFIYRNYSQFLLPTPCFGAYKCWKILDCLWRPTATLYNLITQEYSFQLCQLCLFYILFSQKLCWTCFVHMAHYDLISWSFWRRYSRSLVVGISNQRGCRLP